MEFRIVLIFYYVLLFYQETESSVTVEKGGRATLECPGFVSDPGHDTYAHFNWFKVEKDNNISANNIVATKKDKLNIISGDLEGRAYLDGTTGVLEIPTTRVTDDHYYTCHFRDTGKTRSGNILNETQLIITVTPKPDELKIFGSSQIIEGQEVTYTCKASEVKPPPQQMYFRFKGSDNPLKTDIKEIVTNEDGLTWNASVAYTLTANRTYQGKKLQCVFVASTKKFIISSEEREITVLYKPEGTPSIHADKESTQVNSTITLNCTTEGVDGTITYYLWFANGTEIKKSTKSTYEYKVTLVGKVNFACISGNIIGNTSKSQPLEVEITNIANENTGKRNNGGGDPSNSMLPVIIGGCVGAPLLGLAVGYFLWRHKKKKANSRSQQQSNNVEEPPVVYAEVNKNRGARRGVANGGQADATVDLGGDVYAQPIKKKGKAPQQNGEYGNLGLGEGRAMSEDGLIYATPDFAKPPPTGKGKGKNQGAKAPSAQAPPAGQAAKTSQPNKHMDYTPVEYGELNFTQMKK